MLYDPKRWAMPEVKPQEPWRQVLVKSADLIRCRGWWDGGEETKDGNCPVSAIALLAGSNWDLEAKAAHKLQKYLGLKHASQIPAWNDAPDRSAGEVIAALEGAARS